MARAVVALGSNLGDRLGQLRSGVEGLSELGTVIAVSSLYETDPVGGPEQGRYLNAVAVLETGLDPADLLDALHRIEGDSERTREVRWGPRTLDLDIVAFDGRRIDTPDLTVPHPRAHERRFVLAPLLDVAPDVVLADGSVPADAVTRVRDQRVDRWRGEWRTESPRLGWEAWGWVAAQFVLLGAWLGVTGATAGAGAWPTTVTGLVVAALGIWMGVAAFVAFRGRVTASPQPREGATLIEAGIYRFVRHPMYGALILATSGGSVVARSWPGLAVTAGLAAVLRMKSAREERILGIVIPGYDAYRKRVRRRFIPLLW